MRALSDNVHYPVRRKIADAALPTFSAGLDVPELVTPTGACLVAELATERAVAWPGDGFVPERVGYGAGGRDLADRANVFMAVLGRREPGREPGVVGHLLGETRQGVEQRRLAGVRVAHKRDERRLNGGGLAVRHRA